MNVVMETRTEQPTTKRPANTPVQSWCAYRFDRLAATASGHSLNGFVAVQIPEQSS